MSRLGSIGSSQESDEAGQSRNLSAGEMDAEKLKQLNDQPEEESKDLSVKEQFKQRLAAYRKNLTKTMYFADQMELRNPQLAAEYANDIYLNMRAEENRLRVSPTYLSEVQTPKEVKDTSRAFLIEWIIDVHRKFRLKSETLYVTVLLIDRYLSQ